ncbi:MAG: glycosyltransferase [Nodosilinea sp.]
MTDNSLFYFVNAEGSGHTRRAEAILEHLELPVVVASERPDLFKELSPQHSVHPVPLLRSDGDQQLADDVLHMPYGTGCRYLFRVQTICDLCQRYRCALAVIDVCVETAMIMRLAGIPYWYMRMSGQRDDPAHLQCYRAAAGLIASYPQAFEEDWVPNWMRDKTHYGGGIFTPSPPSTIPVLDLPYILVMRGQGTSQITSAAVAIAAQLIPTYRWIGIGFDTALTGANFQLMPRVPDPSSYLQQAQIVIANAGNNSVLEVGYWRKPFIALPEWRFFDEQEAKANQLARHRLAVVLEAWPERRSDWQRVINQAQSLAVETWKSVLSSEGTKRAAALITQQFAEASTTAGPQRSPLP